MSVTILEFARAFAKGRLTAHQFADSYQELWKIEGESQVLLKDDDGLSECLSTIFCLADLLNLGLDKEDYEMDEAQLRQKVSEAIAHYESH